MIKHLFNEEKQKRFNLSYPDLDERKKAFISKSIQILANLDNERFLEVLLKDTEVEQVAYLQDTNFPSRDTSGDLLKSLQEGSGSWKPSKCFIVFENASDNYFLYLAHIDELLQSFYRKREGNRIIASMTGKIEEIIALFETLTLDYSWEYTNWRIERKLSKVDVAVINENLKKIQSDEKSSNVESYEKCIEEFLTLKIEKITVTDKYLESLNLIKKVFERSLMTKYGLKISNKKAVIEKLLKGSGDYNEVINHLDFIIKNIHHDPKNEKGISVARKFSHGEYIYWWLEINKLIYLVLQN